MTTHAFSPLLSELPFGYISANIVRVSISADNDGWWYAPGQAVAISGDHTVKKAGSADRVIGRLTSGLSTENYPTLAGIPAESRVPVALFRGKRIETAIAGANLTAGTEVNITYQGKATAYSATITSTVSGASATGTVPTGPHGIVWKGGSTNATIEVIIY